MKVGTKSVLWGVHCFLVHPWFVALAWWRLYGFPWDPHLWVAFFVHDLGYWGKPNMDGPEGETHPELGGRIMHFLFDKRRKNCKTCSGEGFYRTYLGHGDYDVLECEKCNCWGAFTLGHSRYYASIKRIELSKLCAADKLAFCFEPRWFYLIRAKLSGEIYEYLDIPNFDDWLKDKSDKRRMQEWFKAYRKLMLGWTAKNYRNLGGRQLKNGDRIRITHLTPCRNGHGTPNPYIGMSGTVCDLQDGKFSLSLQNAWLVGLNIKTTKFEFL